jgi:hypothetical protein
MAIQEDIQEVFDWFNESEALSVDKRKLAQLMCDPRKVAERRQCSMALEYRAESGFHGKLAIGKYEE